MRSETAQYRCNQLEKVLNFLDQIGIQVNEKELTEPCFYPACNCIARASTSIMRNFYIPGIFCMKPGI